MNQQLLKQVREIHDVHTRYLQDVRNLTHEQFNKKPAPDQWSVAQVLFHLWNAYNFTETFMEKRIQDNKVTQPTGIKTAYRMFLLKILLALPIKFKAPRAVAEIPEESRLNDLEQSFKQTAANYEKMVENLPGDLENKEIFKHPRIGYINASQTFAFLKAHAEHHQAQLDNLLKTV